MRGRQPDFAQVLDVLAEAVTIRDRADHIIYANRAALDDLGYATLAELQSRPPGEIMADYHVLDEFGRPLSMDDMPSVRLMRGEPAEPLLMRTVNRSSGALQWKLLKATALRDDAGRTVATVMIIADVTESKNAELRSRFLAEASEMLGSSLDYAQTLQNVAWSVVPAARRLVHRRPRRRGRPARARRRRAFRSRAPRARRAAAARTSRSSSIPPARSAACCRPGARRCSPRSPTSCSSTAARDDEHLALLRGMRIRSALLVPLRTPRRTLGAMTLVMSESGRTFTRADLEFAEQLAEPRRDGGRERAAVPRAGADRRDAAAQPAARARAGDPGLGRRGALPPGRRRERDRGRRRLL